MTTEGNSAATFELEDLLCRLEESRTAFTEAMEECPPEAFAGHDPNSESVRQALERTSDELNFYYGLLAARALNLPQPPCLQKADFLSLREAKISLQVSHRRFTNLLHDLIPADLERTAKDEQGGTYTLRQVLEMAAGQYRLRAQQVRRLVAGAAQTR